jgi:hypothetical protein
MNKQALQKIQELGGLIVENESKVYSAPQLAKMLAEVGENPLYRHDLVIREMGRITGKMAYDDPHRLITAKEIQDIYGEIIGMYPESQFKEVFGELLYLTTEPEKDERPRMLGADYREEVNRNIENANEVGKEVQADEKEMVQIDKVETPEELKPFVESLEENLNLVNSRFSKEHIITGSKLVRNELSKLGCICSYIKFAKSNDRAMMYEASIDTEKGKLKINVPVEVKNGSVLFPIVFALGEDVYNLDKEGMQNFMQKHSGDFQMIRYDGRMLDVPYNELKKSLHAAAVSKDHATAEEILNVVEDRFGTEKHRVLFAEYHGWLHGLSRTAAAKCVGCPYYDSSGCTVGRCIRLGTTVDKIEKIGKHCYIKKARYNDEDDMLSAQVSISNSKVYLT